MLLGQLIELRSAGLQREMISRNTISPAQWFALISIPTAVLILLAIAYNHDLGWQLGASTVFVFAVCASLFVILAHDRPLVGHLGISPIPIELAIKRSQRASADQSASPSTLPALPPLAPNAE